jgi:hypothetical protein
LLAHGSRPVNEIFSEAQSAGYSRDQMKRAKERIGVESAKVGMGGGWVWQISGRNSDNRAPFQSAAPFAPFASFGEGALRSTDDATEADL